MRWTVEMWKRLGYHGASALLHQSSGDLCSAGLTSRVTVLAGDGDRRPKQRWHVSKPSRVVLGNFPGWDAENAWFVSLFGALKKKSFQILCQGKMEIFCMYSFPFHKGMSRTNPPKRYLQWGGVFCRNVRRHHLSGGV